MATTAEIEDALVNAHKAGNVEAARMLADALVQSRSVKPEQPMVERIGQEIRGIPRQLGLTARYGVEGLANTVNMLSEPVRQLVTDPLLQRKSPSASELGVSFADSLGLPKPANSTERVVGDASRLVAGVMTGTGAGQAMSKVPGMVGSVGQAFAANPGMQGISAAGAGLAGGSVREAGGGPTKQFAASLAGGLVAPLAAGSVSDIAGKAKAMLLPKTVDKQVEQQISLMMQRQGVDWSAMPERIKAPMRQDVAQALSTGGQLDPTAVSRLLDFHRVRATPTRGMLTQDPVQITREQNLAKVGANSSDVSLQSLPNVQSRNTNVLLDNLDDLGARNAPDAFSTGQRVLGSLNSQIDASRSNINSLYSAARDTAGRSAQLDSFTFTRNANAALDEANVGSFLTPDIAKKLNGIASGEIPLTVDVAEQLKTAIGNIQRGSADGNVRRALGIVRNSLDNTPLRNAPQVNPTNLPAVPGTVPPSPAVLGSDSIDAFNRARAANRALMARLESTPALQAAADGVQPDQFVQRFILGQGATVHDVQAVRQAIGQSPEALQAVKANIALHLKNAATNGTEDVAKFSPVAYNRALNNIGPRKLAEFFSPDEVAQLQSVGRVGTLMKAQPDGSAVNNSNSGALLIGKGLDILDRISGKLPLGANTMIQGVSRSLQQGKALNVPQSLLLPEQKGLLGLSAPLAIGGGLLSTPAN